MEEGGRWRGVDVLMKYIRLTPKHCGRKPLAGGHVQRRRAYQITLRSERVIRHESVNSQYNDSISKV